MYSFDKTENNFSNLSIEITSCVQVIPNKQQDNLLTVAGQKTDKVIFVLIFNCLRLFRLQIISKNYLKLKQQRNILN